MSKWQRTFTMVVQGRFGSIYTITSPLTCVFDIQKQAASGLNSARFMIYNLNPSTRSDIEYDAAVDIDSGGGSVKRAFIFRAGYVSEAFQPVLFQGSIKKAQSYRDGRTDVITQIEVSDGLEAAQLAQIASSAAAGWRADLEAKKLIATMAKHGVTVGAVGSLFNKLRTTRGVMWLGSTWDVLKKFARASGGYACIDGEKVYMMGQNDVLPAAIGLPRLDATTGLLGTPRRSGATVTAEMLFEPRVRIMQQLPLQSAVNPYINGSYLVHRACHRGTISGAVDGGVVTSLELYNPPDPFVLVTPT